MPEKQDINPSTGQAYAVNPATGQWDDNYWATVVEPQFNRGRTTTSAPVFDYEGIIRRQDEQRKAEQERLNKEQEGLFSQFQTKSLAQPTLESEYGRVKAETGITEEEKKIDVFKSRIGELTTGLNELDQAIKERTAGQFVSEAQRARLVATEKGTIGTELARTAEAYKPVFEQYGRKLGEVGTKLGFVREQQAKELTPLEMRINAFSSRYATDMTGFTAAKKSELDVVLAKIARDQQLSDYELAKADQLAKEERAWTQEKEKMALESKYNIAEKKTTTGGDSKINPYLAQSTAPAGQLKDRSSGGLPNIPQSSRQGGFGNVGPKTDWLAYAYGNRSALA